MYDVAACNDGMGESILRFLFVIDLHVKTCCYNSSVRTCMCCALCVSVHIDLIIDFYSTPLTNLSKFDLHKAIKLTKSFKGHSIGHPLQAN